MSNRVRKPLNHAIQKLGRRVDTEDMDHESVRYLAKFIWIEGTRLANEFDVLLCKEAWVDMFQSDDAQNL